MEEMLIMCIMMVDGASLIYTTSFDSNHVRTLVQSSLGIHSLLKRETIKHNVVDRDKVLIPPNWDSWGKIRILKEGFDIETIATAWSVEIQDQPDLEYDPSTAVKQVAAVSEPPKEENSEEREHSAEKGQDASAVSIFVSSLPNPTAKQKPFIASTAASDVVTVPDTQTFLAEQARILESLRQEDERAERRAHKGAAPPSSTTVGTAGTPTAGASAAEHSAPLNINVGGIQVDAEEVTRRIREREADRGREREHDSTTKAGTLRKEGSSSAAASGQGSGIATPDGGKMQNEALANYFAGLMKKAKGASESPRGGGGGSVGS